jgi:hypothetical protein
MGESEMDLYTVWVGGVEVNDVYLSEREALSLAERYLSDGYDDVVVEKHDR